MKKLLAIMLSVLLLCSAIPFAAVSAAAEPTIELPQLEVKAGDVIEVPILLKNNPGIVSAKIEILYDETALELLTYFNEDDEEYYNQIVLGDGYNDKYVSWGPLGTCLVNFAHGTSKSKNYTDELFATATFKVKDDAAAGTYDLTVEHNNKDFFNCVNDGAVQIDFAAVNGSVTVKAEETPDEPVYTEPTIVLPELNVKAGDTFELPILLKNNPGIVSAKIEVLYDSSVLELLTYFNEDDEEYYNQIVLGDGYNDKYVSWGPLGTCLVNFAHGTSKSKNYTDELFATATFKVKDDAVSGTYPLTLVYNNKDFFNCVNDGAVQIDFAGVNGSVTIEGTAAPEIPCEHEYDADCDPNCNLCGAIRPVHTEGVLHFDAVEADCHRIGNIEYWFCPKCEIFWADEALTQITNSKSVILPALGSENVEHFEAKEPGCNELGNIEYWYCADCDQYWQDEALTQLTNRKNVLIDVVDHNVVHFDAAAPGCHYIGNIEYWFCTECEMFWADEALTQVTNSKSVLLPAIGGDVDHIAAKTPTCTENGNIEYWHCAECDQYWQNEALTELTNVKNVNLAASCKYNAVHTEGIEAGCHFTGRVENWYCANCDVYYLDAECSQVTNYKNLTIPALKDTADYVAAKDATCTENGNVEYWYCAECEQVWTDEALTQLSNLKNVQIAPSCKYNAVHNEAIEPGCHYIGRVENWYCANCDVYYLDADCTQVTNAKNVIIPALKDTADYVAAKTPSCTENGNVEYWTCAECEQVWTDEALTQLSNIKNVTLAASCKYNAVHTEGVAATCTENGLIENWYCANCDVYYLDADCTIVTNAKNLVLVASCKYNAVHTEGIEPGCHYTGWTENWYCANCDVYYLDADCTIITNYKNLVIPALGSENLQHVAYKAPTATENGNIEYWFCPDCEQYWQDEALTQLTNAKNVIIPATGEVVEPEKPETPDSPVTGESTVAVVVALLALIASGVAVVLLKDKKRA